MEGAKAKKARGKKGRAAGRGGAGGASSSSRLEEVFSMASSYLDQCNPSAAALLFEEALATRPDEPRLLDALGEALVELGERERARALFARSASVSPGGGHGKWLQLGALSEGAEAVQHFRRGIALLAARLAPESSFPSSSSSSSSSSSAASPEALLRLELSNAHCSVAEIYMTDLCDEEEAEREADASAAQALAADLGNPEAHSLTASVRLSQQRPAEAIPHLRRACEIMELLFRRLDEDPGDGEEEGGEGAAGAGSEGAGASSAAGMSGAMEVSSGGGGGADAVAAAAAATAAAVPSLASRLSTAKMCMEVELWPEAADVLDRMLAEDDTDMEVWFLLGESLLHSGEVDAALETVETAAAMVAAAIAAQHGKAGGRSGVGAGAGAGSAALAAAAAAARTAAVDFSREAIQALLSTPPKELAAQATQFESLRAAIAKSKGASGASEGADIVPM